MQIPRKRLFWAVSLGHAANDSFMSMRSVLLAFISSYILPMANREVGLAMSAVEMSGAISRPFFGWLADKACFFSQLIRFLCQNVLHCRGYLCYRFHEEVILSCEFGCLLLRD